MAYRTTPLATGYSPSELLYGHSLWTPLAKPIDCVVDYEEFKARELEQKQVGKNRFDKKYRTQVLPKLESGDKVWVKASTDTGAEGIVVGVHNTPESYWVRVGNSEIRRNRKHLRLLEPDIIPIRDREHLTLVGVGEECGAGPEPLKPVSDVMLSSPSVDEKDTEAPGRTEPVENQAVAIRSGRSVRKPYDSDFEYY